MLRIPRDLGVEVVRVRFGEDRVRSQGRLPRFLAEHLDDRQATF